MTAFENSVRKAGRPRSIQSHQAILKATLQLLAEEGIEGMSIEAVAARAGVGKATIYRHWASKDELIRDAILALRADVPIIDTGDIRNDLITLMQKAFQARSRNPLFTKVVFKLVGEVESNPAIFQAFYSRIIAPRMQQLGELLQRAQTRGQLRPDIDTVFVITLFLNTAILNLAEVLSDKPPPDDLAEKAVDTILYGIAAQEDSIVE